MSTTAQEIYDRALNRSTLNSSDLLATNRVLQYITTHERALFLRAARVNPDYFGVEANTAARADHTGVWDLAATPGDVGLLTRAEVAAVTGTVIGVSVGTKVELVLQRLQEVAVPPRAYVRGRRITQIGTELGTNSSNFVSSLKIYYSPVPPTISTLAQSVITPDEWTELIVLPLARTFALRDRRLDEIEAINQELVFMQQLFDEAVIAFDMGVRRPLTLASPIPPASKG